MFLFLPNGIPLLLVLHRRMSAVPLLDMQYQYQWRCRSLAKSGLHKNWRLVQFFGTMPRKTYVISGQSRSLPSKPHALNVEFPMHNIYNIMFKKSLKRFLLTERWSQYIDPTADPLIGSKSVCSLRILQIRRPRYKFSYSNFHIRTCKFSFSYTEHLSPVLLRLSRKLTCYYM